MRFLAWFVLLAIAELAVFIWVGELIGIGWTLAIALATAVIGSFLVRRAGIAVFARLRDRMGSGQIPGRELTHGAAVLVAGALLITPGLITDTIGFLLLVPAIRDLVHGRIVNRLGSRWNIGRVDLQSVRIDHRDGEIIDVEEID